MHRILFAGQAEPGFFIHLLGTLHAHLDGETQRTMSALRCLPLHQGLESTQESGDPYSLILPAWLGLEAEDGHRTLHGWLGSVAEDVNAGRCRVFFDYCNESSLPALPDTIAAFAHQAGIRQLRALELISQNRLMAHQDLPIGHACADLFPVCAWDICRKLLLQEGHDPQHDPQGEGPALPEPRHNILCLNATPRSERLLLLLKLAAAGLIDLQAPDHAEDCQIPYVSFPGLSYDKGQAINLNAVRKGLETTKQFNLLACLDPLLARTPLRVDRLDATGNTLALMIDLHHYRDSRLSLVSETGMDPSHCRITEKTLKPLALGQPCISFGHQNGLDCARELGYATFDDCLDNSYDTEPNWLRRMDAGVRSASAFLRAYGSDAELRQRVRATSLANIRWTLSGFAGHYYERFARPVFERLIWRDGPDAAACHTATGSSPLSGPVGCQPGASPGAAGVGPSA